jgi:hypothetical protein
MTAVKTCKRLFSSAVRDTVEPRSVPQFLGHCLYSFVAGLLWSALSLNDFLEGLQSFWGDRAFRSIRKPDLSFFLYNC